MRMPPWAINDLSTAASSLGLKSRNALVPFDVGSAFELTLSFTGMGKPCRTPRAAPEARVLSAALAASSTVSASSMRRLVLALLDKGHLPLKFALEMLDIPGADEIAEAQEQQMQLAALSKLKRPR